MSSPGEDGSGGETSPSGGGGGRGIGGGPAAAIAGFVVCSILLAIVIALIVYNLYLWRRRRNDARTAKQKLVRQPSPRWKAYQEANGIGGAGVNTTKRRGRDNLGYSHSSGSVNIKGSGPPPTASLDDINLSDDEEEGGNGELNVRYTKNNNSGNFPNTVYKHPGNDAQFHHPDRYQYNENGEEVKIYPTTQTYRGPHLEDPEIQLRPSQLQTPMRRASPVNSIAKESLEKHYNDNNNSGPPPAYSLSKSNLSKPPRPLIQRNSGLALLSPTGRPVDHGTVSLTGMGALECPGTDFGPTTVSHSGSLGYNDY